MGGITLSEEWIRGLLGGRKEKQEEGRDGELWLVCKVNKKFTRKKSNDENKLSRKVFSFLTKTKADE